jgi:hypothetical protein
MLSAFAAAPRMGHFKATVHIFSFLSQHPRCRVVFDDSYIPLAPGPKYDWTAFYPNAADLLPQPPSIEGSLFK